MRKYSFLLLLFLFLFVPLLKAQTPDVNDSPKSSTNDNGTGKSDYIRIPPLPPDQNTLPNILGQEHQYSVILRGNGEAVVTGKMTFANNTEKDLASLDLEGPSSSPIGGFLAYQQERQGSCLSYVTPQADYSESPICSIYTDVKECDNAAKYDSVNCAWYYCAGKCLTTGTPTENVCPASVCDKYEDPDYFTSSYNTKNTYQKLKTKYHDNSITVQLNKIVKPQQSGSIIFYYTQPGVARKNLLGAYDFRFETFKVADKIRNLTLGVSTDPDYFLKDPKGKIDYRNQTTLPSFYGKNMGANIGGASPQMDYYYNQIGFGQIYKTAANLQPHESYKLKGSYADAKWKLYIGDIARNILFFLIAVLILIKAIKVFLPKIFKVFPAVTLPSSKKASSKQNTSAHPFILAVCLSFASSIIVLISILVFIFLNNSSFSYGYASYNLFRPLMVITFTLILLCIDILALFLPAIFMWKKAGTNWGILTFIFNIIWFFFYQVIIFLIIFIFSAGGYQQISPPITPMMKGID